LIPDPSFSPSLLRGQRKWITAASAVAKLGEFSALLDLAIPKDPSSHVFYPLLPSGRIALWNYLKAKFSQGKLSLLFLNRGTILRPAL
jgi:hypothetical protein